MNGSDEIRKAQLPPCLSLSPIYFFTALLPTACCFVSTTTAFTAVHTFTWFVAKMTMV